MAIDSISDIAGSDSDLKRSRRRGNNSLVSDRHPPHDQSAEQGVIGCQLNFASSVAEVQSRLGVADFYDLRHRTIQQAIFDLTENMVQVDVITVQSRLKGCGLLEQVGGIAYLMELQDTAEFIESHLSSWLDIVLEKSLLRRAIETAVNFVGEAYDGNNPDQLMDGFERAVMGLRKMRGGGIKTIREIVQESVSAIEAQFNNKGRITGISTGLPDLDMETDGLHPAELVLIAAFPSVGKTSLAMNIVEHVVLEQNLPVGVFSAEMSSVSLVTRAICSQGRVNLRDVRDGNISESVFPRISSAAARIARSSLHIDDTSDLTMPQMRAKARRMVQQHGVRLIVADYAQLFSSPGAENRTNEIDQVSKGFKNMAKELGVPVILLSQLTEDAKGGIHLKGARALGEDADGYWQLKRGNDSGDTLAEPVELWIKKQRNGPRNVCINLTFLKAFTRFESASKISDGDVPTT